MNGRYPRDHIHQYPPPRPPYEYPQAPYMQMPYSHPAPPPTSDNFEEIDNINGFRKKIGHIIFQQAGRQRLVELYHGIKEEEWVLQELIASMPKYVKYRGGVTLLFKINRAIVDKMNIYPPWIDALFANHQAILNQEAGCELFCDLLPYVLKKQGAMDVATYVVDNFLQRTEESFIKLCKRCIKFYSYNDYIMRPLLSYDWHHAKAESIYLSILIEHRTPAKTQPIVSDFIHNSINYFCDPYLYLVMITIIRLASANEFDQIFRLVYPKIGEFCSREPQSIVVQELIGQASQEQKIKILQKFEQVVPTMFQLPHTPAPFEESLQFLLLSVPIDQRAKFIEENSKYDQIKNNHQLSQNFQVVNVLANNALYV